MKFFFLALTLTTSVFARDFLSLLDIDALKWDMMQEKKTLHFEKVAEGRSDGYLCDGTHWFKVQFDGILVEPDFDLQDTYMDIRLNLKNLYGRADGKYRSINSLCIPVSGWLGLAADWASVDARLHLDEQPGKDLPKVRLEVLKTHVGRLHFGAGVPRWIEDTVTGIVDGILQEIWETPLGDWIEAKISAQLQKKIEEEEGHSHH